MMYRTDAGSSTVNPHAEYFSKRTRRWEIRLQGSFKRKPQGKMFAGVVLKDFDYGNPLGFFGYWLGGMSLTPLEYALGTKVHFTFGDRCEASQLDAAELAHIVGGLEVFDQIVETPNTETPPNICGNLEGQGVERSKSKDYAAAVKEVEQTIELNKSYTLCFWSASRFIDLIQDKLVNLVPLAPSVSLSQSILGQWPPHFVLYVLDSQGEAGKHKHVEQKKTYLVDLMILNPKLPQPRKLLRRYHFWHSRSANF